MCVYTPTRSYKQRFSDKFVENFLFRCAENLNTLGDMTQTDGVAGVPWRREPIMASTQGLTCGSFRCHGEECDTFTFGAQVSAVFLVLGVVPMFMLAEAAEALQSRP